MKRILITGATGGIGQATAAILAQEASELYIHYSENIEAANALVAAVPCPCVAIKADLSSADGAATLAKQLPAVPNVFVDCAGSAAPALLQDVGDDILEAQMHVHLLSPIKLVRSFLPEMLRKRDGVIVLTSSIWGLTGASMESIYAAAKSGLNGFVKSMAKETAMSGIRINAVAPGAIDTNMLRGYNEADLRLLAEDIPYGRLGTAEEVAEAIAFLASDKASYIHGQILSVNGGWYC
ncbi:elongation factor P 5-aminopentanone reductase [Shouchella clausii]|uniref:elongation factor P 5-aminopentanone reductase n=1 Tax=Shouchella clausii TaxID=79880 RepID=UPI002148E2AB|nr:SDR family oxidoreductase [Shouchella clausii]MCR1286216.1 SDR family oxidoreductase [Shouchella clausii]